MSLFLLCFRSGPRCFHTGVRLQAVVRPQSKRPSLRRTRVSCTGREFLAAAHVPMNSCTAPRRHGRMNLQQEARLDLFLPVSSSHFLLRHFSPTRLQHHELLRDHFSRLHPYYTSIFDHRTSCWHLFTARLHTQQLTRPSLSPELSLSLSLIQS